MFSHSVMSNSLMPHGLQLTSSSVHGISQARILDWVGISFCRDGQGLGLAGQQGSWGQEVAGKVKVKVAQLCLTLCGPMDYTAHEILQTRILEWVAIPSSRGSFQPRDRTQVSWIAGKFFTS